MGGRPEDHTNDGREGVVLGAESPSTSLPNSDSPSSTTAPGYWSQESLQPGNNNKNAVPFKNCTKLEKSF